MLRNPEFWVGVGFVIFLGILAYRGVFAGLLRTLDARGERVSAELEEARRLREEAQTLVASYERRRGEAEAEAEAIVAGARAEAERLSREGEAKLAEFVTRRTAAAERRIAMAESEATAEVRAAAADLAADTAARVLRARGADETGLRRALGEVRARMN